MILPKQNLRRHVTRCPTGLLCILRLPKSGNPEICDSGISLLVNNNVFGFDIAMDDISFVEAAESFHEALNQKLYLSIILLVCYSLKTTPLLM